MAKILTLNARTNLLLQITQDQCSMTDCQLFEDIQKMHAKLVSVLARKGIEYDDLSGALVPRTDKNEAAFFFDLERSACQSLPGLECAELIFGLLDRRSSHSVLVGEVFKGIRN